MLEKNIKYIQKIKQLKMIKLFENFTREGISPSDLYVCFQNFDTWIEKVYLTKEDAQMIASEKNDILAKHYPKALKYDVLTLDDAMWYIAQNAKNGDPYGDD